MKTTTIVALSLASLLASVAVSAEDAPKAAASAEDPPAKAMEARLTKGYTRVKKDGNTLYCRKQIALGTRLPSRVCYSMEQLVEIDRIRALDQQKIGTKQVQRPTDDRCGASRCG